MYTIIILLFYNVFNNNTAIPPPQCTFYIRYMLKQNLSTFHILANIKLILIFWNRPMCRCNMCRRRNMFRWQLYVWRCSILWTWTNMQNKWRRRWNMHWHWYFLYYSFHYIVLHTIIYNINCILQYFWSYLHYNWL